MKTCPTCGAQAIDTARVCLRCKAVFPEGMEVRSVPRQQIHAKPAQSQIKSALPQTKPAQPQFRSAQPQTKAVRPQTSAMTRPANQYTAEPEPSAVSANLIFPKSVSTATPVAADDTETERLDVMGPNERKGRRNAVIGAVVLGLIGLCIMGYLFAYGQLNLPSVVIGVIAWMICGAIYGFGYTFGMRYVIDWTCKGLHVAAATTMWALFLKALRREDHMAPWAGVMIIFSATFGLAYGWIPGVFRGIKLIKEERRQIECQN